MGGGGPAGAPPRGQTAVDFAIAMGIFLLGLTIVMVFIPNITQPFTGAQENPLLADRLASQLSNHLLGEPATPSVLDTTCTVWFFNNTPGDPCANFDTADPLEDQLGVESTRFVNVTLEQNVTGDARTEVVCSDAGGIQPCSAGGTVMGRGEIPPDGSGSVTVARRDVHVDGQHASIVVRVWT